MKFIISESQQVRYLQGQKLSGFMGGWGEQIAFTTTQNFSLRAIHAWYFLFLENANGTSPHAHIKYYFDPNAIQYITKND